MLHRYRAADPRGRIAQGELDAVNLVDLEARLLRLELDLIDAKPVAERPGLWPRRSGVSRQELIGFCFHLQQLVGAGVPLLEGLIDLRDSLSHRRFREIVANVIEDIEGGLQLSQALAAHPAVFEPVFVNLIRSGEASGELAIVLGNLVDSLKWQDELAAQTKKILLYPAFVGGVIAGVIFFLMIYLVPQLVKFIKSMQQTLPWNTRALIAISDFFVGYWYVLLALPFAIQGAVWLWRRVDPGSQYKLDRLKLQLPALGPLLKKIVMARFANFFALLYGAGISILDAIKILEGVVGNQAIAVALAEAHRQISEGMGVTASFEQSGLFPPLVLRMLKVGESTGALDTALANVSYFYNREVKESIERVQALIEPVMTVVLGLIMGSVMLSVLGPIYDIIGKLK